MKQEYVLTLADVQKINEKILSTHSESDSGIAIAIVDTHGELMSFLRTDGCPVSAVNIAINKAFTAARDRIETEKLHQVAVERGFVPTSLGDIRYTDLSGGIPIVFNDQVLGAIGISGLAPEDDVRLAQASLQALFD